MIPPIFCNLYLGHDDLGEAIYDFFTAMIDITGLIRSIVILRKQRKFLNLFGVVESWYEDLKQPNEHKALETLNQIVAKVQLYSKCCLYSLLMVDVTYAFEPIITHYGKLVVELQLPSIDLHQSPVYEMVYLIQALWLVPLTSVNYVSYSNSLLIFTIFGVFATRHLQQKLMEISQMEDDEALANLKQCVVYHSKIIKFGENLEELYSLMSLLDISLYCISVCLMLVYLTMDFTWPLLFKGVIVILFLTTLIFLTYHVADVLTHESMNIAELAYNTNWMDRDKEFRSCIQVIIVRSQRPLMLTAGGFQPMNMKTFLAIMRASYSFFSVLRSTV
ncbi:odorant receptor 30a-like [Ceratitis capitata]|uniref:odorant receptor 30a-like n=1 Tax=Ceratitis capitata TaxID=7213 RepID=UPI00032A3C97|nr:odorant receptor 30a-like [Ceratitis capitata]